MARAIVSASLRFRFLVVPIAAGLIVAGVSQLRKAPVDVLPEFTRPVVEVQTESLGLSGAEVEQLITVPLEQDLLNGVRGIDTIRSDSVPGLSSIVMTFDRGTDLYHARLLVQERLAQAAALPNVSKPPQMLQPVSSTNRVQMIGLSTSKLSAIELSVLARWTIRPRLMGLAGVANVAIWGFRDRQLQVQVDPRRMRDRGVSLSQVIRTTGNAQLVSSLTFVEASTPGTGGFIDGPSQRLSIRHIVPFGKPANLAKVPIEGRHGAGLRLGDVATVVEDHQPLIGDAVVDNGPGLLLVVEKLPGANTLEVTRRVEEALDDMRTGLAGVRIDTRVFRPASFIESGMHNLGVMLIAAGALVLAALAAFFLRARPVAICLLAVVLSLVTAGLVLDLTGATINALVVAGLVVALGIVIDDAVGDVHGALRRLEAEGGHGAARGLAAAVLETRSAMGYATLIVVLAIVPVFFAGGLTGAFIHPMALSYVLAVLASMVVALTVTPALCLLMFGRRPPAPREFRLVTRVRRGYDSALGRFVGSPRLALLTLAACLAVGLVALLSLGHSLRPTFKDRDLLVKWNANPSTSLTEMDRITARATRELRALPGVRDVGAHVGRAVTADQVVGTGAGEMWISMGDDADYDRTLRAIRRVVAGYPGVKASVRTYEDERSAGVLTPPDDTLDVRVYGEDYAVLRRIADGVRRDVSGVDGIAGARVLTPAEQPTLQIEVSLDAARRHGVKPGDVRRAAGALVNGLEVGSFFEQQKVFAVVVRGTPAVSRDLSAVRGLLIDTPGGGHVRLGDVAQVRIRPNPVDFRHDAVSRYVDVRADVRGRDVGSVRDEVRDHLLRARFPLEYHAEVLEPSADVKTPAGRFLSLALAAALGGYLVLQAAFGSWRLATLMFLMLPMALTGGLLVMLAGGGDVSLGAAIGLLTVLGIAVRHGIVLIRRFEEDGGAGGEPGQALVRQVMGERLAPIVMTAATTALALLPFVIAGDVAGNEIAHSTAAVVLGGLATSTLLSLLVLPAVYVHFRRAAGEREGPAPAAARVDVNA